MSENDSQSPSTQTSSVVSKLTSSIPLKKETVRVTLKASDAPAIPSANLPSSPAPVIKPPTPPVVQSAPPIATRPPVIQPPSLGVKPPPAPTIALRNQGALPAGAPTIKLATTNAPVGAPSVALKTANTPLSGAGPVTLALPKATVGLNPPTKPMSPTSSIATQQATLSAEEAEDETGASTFFTILTGVGLTAALLVLGLQLKMANIWISAEEGSWSMLLD